MSAHDYAEYLENRGAAPEFGGDHDTEVVDQVSEARDALTRPDGVWVSWPWPDLTALLGRMKPRDIVYVCGFSGNGKTLFISSAVMEWVRQQVKVYVLPLENAADDFRLYLACQSAGVDPGLVNSGRLLDMDQLTRRGVEKRIDTALVQQTQGGMRDHLKVKGVSEINLARLTLAAEEASEWGARILIVDHIDHIQDGDGTNLHAESVKVNMAAKQLAKRHNLIFLFTSQMNNAALARTKDKLAQFGPPSPDHVYMGGHKRFVATTMIGLHRRLRDQQDGETQKEYIAALKLSRDGDLPALDALQPNVMAVTAMKLRNDGSKETHRAFLDVRHGVVSALPEKDRYKTTFGTRAGP